MKNKKTPQYIALYGTLQMNEVYYKKFQLNKKLKFIDTCEFKGVLYDLGDYPGYCHGDGLIHGQLYEILDESVFDDLDVYEEYDKNNYENSLYIRDQIKLHKTDITAWIYIYNQKIKPSDKIIYTGNWIEHIK